MTTKAIEVKNLNYIYPDGLRALKDINLEVHEGEALGIIGPNGAGKSTFLLHLNGILKGDGEIRIFGTNVNEDNITDVRKMVGLVFQDPETQLFMPTVFDDVAFGPINMKLSRDEVQKTVASALEEVDMSGSSDRIAHHLSFGEKKRISIATVLSMSPSILVLDEPSSNLDPRHRRQLINLLKRLDHTKIIATHDLGLVSECCERVALFDNGELITIGNTADIIGDQRLLESHLF